jgi:hypothetical protein
MSNTMIATPGETVTQPDFDDTATARQIAELTQRFIARLDHVTAMLERMEMDERRMTPLHRRAVTRELRQSARECHEALRHFSGWLALSPTTSKEGAAAG